ncbi:hypothetical protein CAEBREN_23058 [Caenorhabditis brenneri]|uniref:Uncharacterized protein n=1 Tax=Caenorhabditis brenneri TaxID=135651 RepID=G0N938_CAEBE|nr:hypothetical protein CAEBREN_23058 [Caenorhabditis brenneri]
MEFNFTRLSDKETSLSEFIENAWDRKLNLQFESSFAPVYVLCHDKNTNTLNRRGGAVLEVVAKNRRTDRLERNRWIAVFRYEPKAGYYLEYLKDLEAIQLEGEEEETTLDQEEVFMNSTYICPFKKEMNSVINRNLEGLRVIVAFFSSMIIVENSQGPPGIPSAPVNPPPSNPITAAPIRRQPSVVQTTWSAPIEQSNSWQQSQQPQQPPQSNWGQDQNDGPPPGDRWGPPDWRDRGPPPPDFDDWHHRPPWRRGPWWRRGPPPPWGPPPPGPPPPPFGGWRGL